MLRSVCTSLARWDTDRARLKRVLRASTIARMGPTRGAKPSAAAEGTATAAREATMLTTCESVSMALRKYKLREIPGNNNPGKK